jgi:membrane protein
LRLGAKSRATSRQAASGAQRHAACIAVNAACQEAAPVKAVDLVKRTAKVWSDSQASSYGAALSYYTLFSLAPLLVIALAVAGMIFGDDAASGQLEGEIRDTVGANVASAIQDLIRNAHRPNTGSIAIVVSVVVLILGASGVFNELQTALNAVWEVKPKEGRGIWGIIKDRFLSFSMVAGTCFLMLASLIITTLVSALSKWWTPESLPGGAILWQGINQLVSLGVVTTMFALIYKVLPDVHLSWRHVWVGAFATALLFTLGKFLLGLYLGRSSTANSFGAAGSLAVVLIWVYYSAQIILFGAAFTRVHAEDQGHVAVPTDNAVTCKRDDRISFSGKPKAPAPSHAALASS